jgi:hypothetical protein
MGPARTTFFESKRYHCDGVPFAASTRVCGAERRSKRLADATGTRADRRAGEIRLEVVELEHGRLADQLRGRGRIVDAGELDDDLIRALLADLGLRDSELVDPLPHNVDRPGDVVRGQLVVLGRNRLQDDLETSLEIEAERGLLVYRRARERQEADADQRRQDAAEQDQVVTAIFQAESGGRVAGVSSSGDSSGPSSSLNTPATARLAILTTTPSAISTWTSSPSSAVTVP